MYALREAYESVFALSDFSYRFHYGVPPRFFRVLFSFREECQQMPGVAGLRNSDSDERILLREGNFAEEENSSLRLTLSENTNYPCKFYAKIPFRSLPRFNARKYNSNVFPRAGFAVVTDNIA